MVAPERRGTRALSRVSARTRRRGPTRAADTAARFRARFRAYALLRYEYCDAHGIPYDRVGKLIVAVDESEMLPLMKLWYRAKANGVEGAQLVRARLGQALRTMGERALASRTRT